jgi:hypothetical protein
MKRILLYLLIATSALTACEQDNCSPERFTSSFATGKSIVVHYNEYNTQQKYYEVKDGENLVFRYEHRYPQCDDVYDAVWGTVLYFEADKDATQFRFEDAELAAAKSFYSDHGGIAGAHQRDVVSGLIEGTKISENKWKVKAAVTLAATYQNEQPRQIAFERVFDTL